MQNGAMRAREMGVEEAAALIRSRDAIGFGIITGTPVALLRALGARDDWEDLTFSGGLSLGSPEIFLHPNVHYRVSFYGGHERALAARGADVQHVPSFLDRKSTRLNSSHLGISYAV